MLSLRLLLLSFLPFLCAHLAAQVTLVPGGANDTFDLAPITLTIREFAVFKGRPEPTFAYQPPDKRMVNQLHWRYFDEFLGRQTLYPRQLLTQPCTQLIDEVPDDEFISLNITLEATDSAGRQMTLLLQIAGLQKWQLERAPLRGLSEADPEAPQRLSALIRIRPPNGPDETYDSTDGLLEITALDVKKQTIAGNFYLETNRIGRRQKAWFFNGSF